MTLVDMGPQERRRVESEIRALERALAMTRRALAAVRGEPVPDSPEVGPASRSRRRTG